MPPPSYCSEVSTRSAGDHEPELKNDTDNSKTDSSNFDEKSTDEDSDFSPKYDGVGIVKSLLGPSLEDAVLRTLEFGKSLIQKTEENETSKMPKPSNKKGTFEDSQKVDFLVKEGKPRMTDEREICPESMATRKRFVYAAELEKDALMCPKPNSAVKKFTNVSKIRSLDSDLKQVSPSPEKIKRQLEALIQIHKNDPNEPWNFMNRTNKLPMEMTVMPSFCTYGKNETGLNCSSTCDVQSECSRKNNEGDNCSTSRLRTTAKKRLGAPNKICQAPEFLSNALGPTLDVSIIDNLKMMRDIFKCDSARGEGMASRQETSKRMAGEFEVRLQHSEVEMACRIEELQRKIEELERKEECLMKQINEEEQERDTKRKAFEEEEHRLCSMKACLESLVEEKGIDYANMTAADCAFEAKYECLQQRISAEEEKLSRLKEQYDVYKREICEARNKKDALKRNKSLLDAWDVIASRVCHTRLPSFSKAYNLERKNFQPSDISESVHCCLTAQVNQTNQPTTESSKSCSGGRKSRSRSRCGRSTLDFCFSSSDRGRHESQSPGVRTKKHEDIPFPIQRDITCGLHQSLKTCCCTPEGKGENVACGSENDLYKKYGGTHNNSQRETCCYTSSVDTSAEALLRKPPCGKAPCISKSDTTLRNKNAKIVKVMWAVTRINIFQDNCRTYEVMDATSTPPSCTPAKTEGIFVVKSAQKKRSQSPLKRKLLR